MSLYLFKDIKKNVHIPIFFVHIPKCAGTTVEILFEQLGFKTFLAPKDYMWLRGFLKQPPVHYDITLIENMFRLDIIYTFAIVRNPYSRILSDYKWAKTQTTQANFFQNMSFEEFCIHSIKEYSSDNTYLANHLMPQYKFISQNVNKIFKLEEGLEKAIEEVFVDIGLVLSDKLDLQKINATSEETIEINQNTKDLIYDFYELDFKTFGYKR